MTQLIDREGHATIVSAEGQAALAAGDTAQAKDKFTEAGEILQREMRGVKDDETEHLLRFSRRPSFSRAAFISAPTISPNRSRRPNSAGEPGVCSPNFWKTARSVPRRITRLEFGTNCKDTGQPGTTLGSLKRSRSTPTPFCRQTWRSSVPSAVRCSAGIDRLSSSSPTRHAGRRITRRCWPGWRDYR